MRFLLALMLLLSSPLSAQLIAPYSQANQASPLYRVAPVVTSDPAADYITPGQDEAGYRSWVLADPSRPPAVASFYAFLSANGIAGIVPTWQLLRTATDWQKCSAQPFEVAPSEHWPHLIEALRFIQAHIIPVIGPVEPVSVYRDPALNACAHGAPGSAHQLLYAIDLVPMRPTDRDGLIRGLCAIHLWRGTGFDVGLGFYKGLRFHVDGKKYRKWGGDGRGDTSPCAPVVASLPAILTPSEALPPPLPAPQR